MKDPPLGFGEVLFESTAKEASLWLNSIGTTHVTETDITALKKYDAIAWIANESGTGDPVTFPGSSWLVGN